MKPGEALTIAAALITIFEAYVFVAQKKAKATKTTAPATPTSAVAAPVIDPGMSADTYPYWGVVTPGAGWDINNV